MVNEVHDVKSSKFQLTQKLLDIGLADGGTKRRPHSGFI